jgi:hypothetical protein
MTARRSVPPIDPRDLRQLADGERVERIWERLEPSLVVAAPRRRAHRRDLALGLLAASLSAFGVGLVVGKAFYEAPAPVAVPAPVPTDVDRVEVFAAGTQPRAYALPGGGEVRLTPGATVELENGEGGALTLRLVQGEALVDAAPRSREVAVIAGDAHLASSAGSRVLVSRGPSHMDVVVSSGTVSLESPGSQRRELAAGDRATEVPLHTVTANTPNPTRRDRSATPPQPEEHPPVEAAPVVVAAPAVLDWRAHWLKGNDAEALRLLRDQPGGVDAAIGGAKSGSELMDISSVSQRGGDGGAAMRAAKQVIERFPGDPNAVIAASQLKRFYEKAARSGDPAARAEADKWTALHKKLDSAAMAAGVRGIDAQLCNQFRDAWRDGRKDEAAKLAQEYVTKYPNGICREEADRISKGEDLPADEGATPAPPASGDAKPAPEQP